LFQSPFKQIILRFVVRVEGGPADVGNRERVNAVRLVTETSDPDTISRMASDLAAQLEMRGFP
jgi:hypothetical protein